MYVLGPFWTATTGYALFAPAIVATGFTEGLTQTPNANWRPVDTKPPRPRSYQHRRGLRAETNDAAEPAERPNPAPNKGRKTEKLDTKQNDEDLYQ